MLTLRGPYCVVTEGSVTTWHDMTARHRHNGEIDNPSAKSANNDLKHVDFLKHNFYFKTEGIYVKLAVEIVQIHA